MKIAIFCLHYFLCRSAYILKQDSLPSSYKSFLNKHGGKDLSILQGVKDVVNHTAFSNLAGIEKYYKSVGVDIKLDPNMKVPCSVSLKIHMNELLSYYPLYFEIWPIKRPVNRINSVA